MKVSYTISQILMQSSLAEILLIAWQLYEIRTIPETLQFTGTLLMLIGTFSFALSMLCIMFRLGYILRAIITTVGTSALVTIALFLVPELGVSAEWYVIFGVMLFSAIISHMLLYSAGATAQHQEKQTVEIHED